MSDSEWVWNWPGILFLVAALALDAAIIHWIFW